MANTKTSLEGARTALSASLKALRVAREAAERHVANVTGPAVNAALSEVAAAQRVLRQKSETLERAAIHGLSFTVDAVWQHLRDATSSYVDRTEKATVPAATVGVNEATAKANDARGVSQDADSNQAQAEFEAEQGRHTGELLAALDEEPIGVASKLFQDLLDRAKKNPDVFFEAYTQGKDVSRPPTPSPL